MARPRKKWGWLILGLVAQLVSVAAHADKPAGVSSQTLKLPNGPASMKGLGESFSANPGTGTGSYSVPLTVPPGFVAPTLSLQYTGGSGKGPLGLGWQLPTLQVYRSRDKGAPRFDEDDRFSVKGTNINDELVRVDARRGLYRLKNEGAYVLFERDAFRDRWTLHFPNGETAVLGDTGESRQTSRGRTYRWFVSYYEDRFEHRAEYAYLRDAGKLYLHRIRYQLHAAADYHNEVSFEYEPRPDPSTDYSYGDACTARQRLSSIAMYHGARRVRHYDLTYEQAPLTSLLSSVTLHAGSLRLPTLRFDYLADIGDPGGLVAMANIPPLEGLANRAAELEDVDGDGLPDLLYGWSDDYYYYQNLDGRRFDPRLRRVRNSPDHPLFEQSTVLVDINGDGFRDLLHSHGDSFRYYPGGDIADGEFLGFADPVTLTSEAGGFHFGAPELKLSDLDSDGRIDLLWQKPGRDAMLLNGPDNALREHAIAELPVDVDFRDPRVQFSDFNGDGELDLVLKDISYDRGRLTVWFGLGHGRFTDPMQMAGVPMGDPEEFHLQDVNRDGQTDLVRVSGSWAAYYLNDGDLGFTARQGNVYGLPSAARTEKLLFADMNGNGSRDIVWATFDSELYYLDLTLEPNAGLLARIDNGMGMVTTLEYRSSTELAAEARASGEPWAHPLPTPVPVLTEIRQTDSLDALGMEPTITRTTFDYRDGYYDGKEREFRGFGRVVQTEWGDDMHETLVTEQHMHVGRDPVTGEDQEVLKGKAYLTLSRSVEGELIATSEATWEQRWLCQEDLTAVSETILPNCNDFVDLGEHKDELVAVGVSTQRLSGLWERTRVPRYTAERTTYDEWGKPRQKELLGEVKLSGWHEPGEPFDLSTADVRVANDELIERTRAIYDVERWLIGLAYEERATSIDGETLRLSYSFYDGQQPFVGQPLGTATTGNMVRRVAWDNRRGCEVDDLACVCPLDESSVPAGGSQACWVATERIQYSDHGQAIATLDPNDHLVEVEYGATGFFATRETFYTESAALSFDATVDLAHGVLLSRTDPNGRRTLLEYDDLARLHKIAGPRDTLAEPTIAYEYDEGSPSYPISTTTIQTLIRRAEGDATASRLTSYQYSDGTGRQRLVKTQAEAPLHWVGSDWTVLSARGKPSVVYEKFASDYPGFEAPPESVVGASTYRDPLSRPVSLHAPPTVDLPATRTLTQYLPLETRAYSERDVLEGTLRYPTITQHDGRGRPVRVLKRNRMDGADQELEWEIRYAPTGEIVAIVDPGGHNQDAEDARHRRHYDYDSMGRMYFLRDPSLGGLHYRYDDAGNLLERLDARGQRQRWQYGAANRLLRHTTFGRAGDQEDTFAYHYDYPAPTSPLSSASGLLGHVSWVEFPTGTEHYSYDEQGRTTERATSLWDPSRSNFEAQERSTFRRESTFDAYGKVLRETLPGGLELAYDYNARDMPTQVRAGFDGVLEEVFSGIAYDARGKPIKTANGNGTTTCFAYDARQQLVGALTAQGLPDCGALEASVHGGSASGLGIHHVRYHRGLDGQIASVEDRSVPTEGGRRLDAAYRYDRIDQLVGVGTPYGDYSYSYDELQNMVRREITVPDVDLPTGRFEYGKRGASPTALTDVEGGESLSYDTGGFLETYRGYDLSFDARGKLKSAYNATTRVYIRHHYDAYGERRISTVTRQGEDGSHVYRYVDPSFEERDGEAVWLIAGGAGTLEITESPGLRVDLTLAESVRSYYAGVSDHKPLPEDWMDVDGDGDRFDADDVAEVEAAAEEGRLAGTGRRIRRYFHRDHLTSTVEVTDSVGDVVTRQRFHPFGKQADREGQRATRGFHGAMDMVDPDLGLLRFGARYYAPDLGRWISPDYWIGESPKRAASKLLESGLYAYARNNPVRFLDPHGTQSAEGEGGGSGGDTPAPGPAPSSGESATASAPEVADGTAAGGPEEPTPPPLSRAEKRALASLHPDVRPLALAHRNAAMLAGYNAQLRPGLRTYREQRQLYAKGRDKDGNVVNKNAVVTKAKAGKSLHNFGLAYHITVFNEAGTRRLPDSNPAWQAVADMAPEGVEAGANWRKFKDRPHYEYRLDANSGERLGIRTLQTRWEANQDPLSGAPRTWNLCPKGKCR